MVKPDLNSILNHLHPQLTLRQKQAVYPLLIEIELTNQEITNLLGISLKTVQTWEQKPYTKELQAETKYWRTKLTRKQPVQKRLRPKPEPPYCKWCDPELPHGGELWINKAPWETINRSNWNLCPICGRKLKKI